MNDMQDAAAQPAPETLPDVTKGWGSETFALAHPFRFAGLDYRAIVYRVPTGADLAALIEQGAADNRGMALRLCQADAPLLEAMHGSDYAGLMRRMGEFWQGSR